MKIIMKLKALNTRIIKFVDIYFYFDGEVRLDISHYTLNKTLEVYKLKFKHRPLGYKNIFMLNSTEHEILIAHKN